MHTPESSLLLLCLVQVVSATLGFLLSNQSLHPEQSKKHVTYHEQKDWNSKDLKSYDQLLALDELFSLLISVSNSLVCIK